MSKTFFKIIKWKNLLYIAFIQFLFKIFFLHGYGFDTKLSFFDLFLLQVSTFNILAAGFLINYYARKKGVKHLKYPVKKAKNVAIFFAMTSVTLGFVLSFNINKPYYGFIGVFNMILITFYSLYILKKTIFTNIINSFIKAYSVLLVWWCDVPVNLTTDQWELFFKFQLITIFYISLSFIGNIARDSIVDIININHDYTYNHQTVPIVLGRRRTKTMVIVISILSSIIVLIFAIWIIEIKFIRATILLLGTVPQLHFIYYLLKARSNNDYKALLQKANIVYFLAVMSIPIVAYYFKYVIK
ncbi:UbiA family prenyltransferase [Tenacibaculum sp. nBUS_03]|uniref:UbiA family prenyltransferase n=1 Tax=Tenacibaculum sp. nBUS_03 TaxID=3395320 RepID=UPI003EBBB27D